MKSHAWIVGCIVLLGAGLSAPAHAACNGTETLTFRRACRSDRIIVVLRNGTPRIQYPVCLEKLGHRVIGCRAGLTNDRGRFKAKWTGEDTLGEGCYVAFIEYCINQSRPECCTE